MALNIILRPARVDEFEVLAAIKTDAGRRYGEEYVPWPFQKEAFEEHCNGEDIVVAVDPDDRPQGYSMAFDQDNDLYLSHLFVRRDCGRQGIGTALLKNVIERAGKLKRRAITLMTGKNIPWNAP
ncbi:MAG: GNAT family N-acetyltransferase, partial [Alphaproteobacteria bacterium]|nr:GNAT family N-acetyltransferase [Alphaproteobacteria bacterium]